MVAVRPQDHQPLLRYVYFDRARATIKRVVGIRSFMARSLLVLNWGR